MAEHVLKVVPPYFDALWSGDRTFEVRKNDRGYQTGDMLTLWEYGGTYSDCKRFPCPSCKPRWIKARVTYVFTGDPRWPALEPGYVVLALLIEGYSETTPTQPPSSGVRATASERNADG